VWTKAGGMEGLGDLAGGSVVSMARGVSADGSVVVGESSSASGPEAFLWTRAGDMQGLGDLPGSGFNSAATDVSWDGSVVVGRGWSASGTEAFRWETGIGMTGLGDLPGGSFFSLATSVSADGTVVVGHGNNVSGEQESAIWTTATEVTGLGHLGDGYFSSAMRVSGDGSTVVGYSRAADNTDRFFRWTQSEGLMDLLDVVGADSEFNAKAASYDGSILGGEGAAVLGSRASIWDATNGMCNMQELLTTGYGLDLTGWALQSVRDISPDGTVIVGWGVNPSGNVEAWIATVPEPSALVLLGMGGIGLVLFGRRVRRRVL